ncbi:MAG: hypothetical protein ACOCVF_00335 [bacterium]
MSKYSIATEDLENFFYSVKEITSIPEFVEFKVLVNDKQKTLFKIQKLNDLMGTITEGIDYAVIINERLYNEVPEETARLAMEEELTGVTVSETDTLGYEQGDFVTHTGFLMKYGNEAVVRLKEVIRSAQTKLKEEDDRIKAETKGKRGRPSKDS